MTAAKRSRRAERRPGRHRDRSRAGSTAGIRRILRRRGLGSRSLHGSRSFQRCRLERREVCRLSGLVTTCGGSRAHLRTDWGDVGYGYQWWVNPDGAYRAIGIFGQMIFLDARSDIVIVTNSAWPEADWDPGDEAVDAFNRAVVKALRPDDSIARPR